MQNIQIKSHKKKEIFPVDGSLVSRKPIYYDTLLWATYCILLPFQT